MNTTSIPKFLITEFLQNTNDFDDLRKKLFEKGVYTKDYVENGLFLLYHKFDAPTTTELERETRSLIIDKESMSIVSYSCETPYMNEEGYNMVKDSQNLIITPCYEGTYLSVFNYKDKWYVSTRRCLNSKESLFNTELSHFDMFEETLKEIGYDNFELFSNKLDKSKSYYFVLIHHLNKHIIDYSKEFGENYKRLCLTTVRDKNMTELDIYNYKFDFELTDKLFIPKKLESLELISSLNYNDCIIEGLIIRKWSEEMSKYNLIKLQTDSFQFATAIGKDKNVFKGMLFLYQKNRLKQFLEQNEHLKKIVNPLNTTESYDTLGIIDSIFKVLPTELFSLFKLLWSLKTGKTVNKEIYNLLPKEYKTVMYYIRGIYYKKKALLFNETKVEITETFLKSSDIYNLLKTLDITLLLDLIKVRKLMQNWAKINKSLKDYNTISSMCNKIHLKLFAIYTNKLYPDIMPTDIPTHEITTAIAGMTMTD